MAREKFQCDIADAYTTITADLEILTVIHNKCIFCVLYRPPSGSVANFFTYMETFLSWINANSYELVLGGDININMLKDTQLCTEFTRLLEANACFNSISMPTRVNKDCESLLDVFITNFDSQRISSGVISAQISDHLPVFFFMESYVSHADLKHCPPLTFQDVNPATLEEFRTRISKINWLDVYNQSDADTAYELFLRLFKKAYSESFPHKALKPKKARKPWVTNTHLKLIKQKDALFKRFIDTRNASHLSEFKKFRNKVTATLRKAKTDYLHRLFNPEAIKRTDITWRNLSTVLNIGRQHSEVVRELMLNGELLSGAHLANAFNNYFVSLVNSSHDQRSADYLNSRNRDSAFLRPTSTEEIYLTFSGLRNSKSCDIDDLQIGPVKHVLDLICPVLEHVYNLCFEKSVFPKRMQLARVTVLFKSGDKNNMSNYRPISILPVFSKCLEKLITLRMTTFCEKHNIITDCQFGFRKGRSTELALLTQKELILQAFEQKLVTLGVFIDFSKAFDTINHTTLLTKLEIYGFRGPFLNLLKSYLQFRYQRISINNCLSNNLPIQSGVPQGSILGPLLFNIYINDIINIDTTAQFIIYADDTSLFFTSGCVNNLLTLANATLDELNRWSLVNSLSINNSKTKAVLFQPKNKKENIDGHLRMGPSTINFMPSVKCLGVVFQENLCWDLCIDSVANKLARVVGILTKLQSFLPFGVKRLLYNALFLSHVNYCHLVWGNTTLSNIRKLFLLQKKAVRAITNSTYDAHTHPLFCALNLQPVPTIYHSILLRRFTTAKKQNDKLFEQLSLLTTNSNSYKTRHKETWYVPKARTNYGHQMLRHTLPSLLNSLETR